MHDALQVFLLFVYPTINTEDVTTLYINFLTPVFSKPVFKTPFRDLPNYKKSNWLYFLDWHSFRSTQLNCWQYTELFGEYIFRIGRPELSYEKCFLENFAKLDNFIKTGPWHGCCPVKFAKFSKTPILWNICERLLLCIARLQ